MEPRPASTIVLVRPGTDGIEILLTRRPPSMAFAGGMHVFPGGSVDERDVDPRLVTRSRVTPEELAERWGGGIAAERAFGHAAAALRELFEEAGVLLSDDPSSGAPDLPNELRDAVLRGEAGLAEAYAALGATPAVGALAPLSRWVTPPIMERRFDTRFFVAELPAGVTPRFDPSEVVDHGWLTARSALEAMAEGAIALWTPTATTLLHLEHVRSFGEVGDRLAPGPSGRVRVEEPAGGIRRIVQPGGAGVPGLEVNGYLVGRRDQVAVDPGDPSEEVFEAFVGAASAVGGRIVGVALTAPLAEHVGGAEGMAIRLEVPVFAGPRAGRRVPFQVVEVADGERLPVGDLGLQVIKVPSGIALVSSGIALCGDAFGEPPARAVRPAVDPAGTRATREALLQAGAKVMLPGHGSGATMPGSAPR